MNIDILTNQSRAFEKCEYILLLFVMTEKYPLLNAERELQELGPWCA